MTPDQVRQNKRNEALNKIRKVYSNAMSYDPWDESSYAEQRDWQVTQIIQQLDRDLKSIKS